MGKKIVKVELPAWSETSKALFFLTVRSADGKSWSCGSWFPRGRCSVVADQDEKGSGLLTMPLWLFNKKSKEGVQFTNLQNKII